MKIYQNISEQNKDGSFLFCLNQGVEDLRAALINEGQKLVRESFFIENKHGYNLFLIKRNASNKLKVFNPEVYDFQSESHKNYINSLLDYYQLKNKHCTNPKYSEYCNILKEIFIQFK